MSGTATYKLYGGRGGGSAAVEVALTLAGLPYELIEAASWSGPDAQARRAEVDFVGQIPILAAPDGEIMTESAAMLLWIADIAPQAQLAPPPGDPRRRAFLRWLQFLAANIYATCIITDHPEHWVADEALWPSLQARAIERRKALWLAMERAVAPAPFLTGATMTIADPYLAMMTRWRPGRGWFEESCPKLAAASRAAEAHPVVAEIWARNFS